MKYFYEKNTPGYKIGFEISKKLYSKKNKYHKIEVFKTSQDTTLLAINGEIKFTSGNEAIYSETMVHYSMFSHPNPERILIIGGGDGSILKEVLKHKRVQEIYLVEKDEEMIKVSKEFFSEFEFQKNEGNKKVKIALEDEAEFLTKFEDYFNIIILDSQEQRKKGFYGAINKTLKKEGLFIKRLGRYITEKDSIKKTKKDITSCFSHVELFKNTSFMEDFYIMASKRVNIKEISLKIINTRFKQFPGKAKLKYYSPEIYILSRNLSKYQQQELK